MEKNSLSQEHIVFFDGVCHLCNSFVDIAISKDRHHRLKFAPLQGVTAALLLPPESRLNLNTVIYFESGILYQRSNAILKVGRRLGGISKMLSIVGEFVPLFIRDNIYDFIAKRRLLLFGERNQCRLPLPEEKAYLLP